MVAKQTKQQKKERKWAVLDIAACFGIPFKNAALCASSSSEMHPFARPKSPILTELSF